MNDETLILWLPRAKSNLARADLVGKLQTFYLKISVLMLSKHRESIKEYYSIDNRRKRQITGVKKRGL